MVFRETQTGGVENSIHTLFFVDDCRSAIWYKGRNISLSMPLNYRFFTATAMRNKSPDPPSNLNIQLYAPKIALFFEVAIF